MKTPKKTPIEVQKLALPAKDAAALVGISRAQWWKLHAAGKLPLPVYLGTKAPRWRADELRDWLAAGAPDRQTWQRLWGAQRCQRMVSGGGSAEETPIGIKLRRH
jgi:predicted DNA-binding transcriptional regulator AlpA